MKKIGITTPRVFENFLILSLDLSWLNVFKKMPVFTVLIDEENRLVLISQKLEAVKS